jgi:hypothetical protein
MNDEIEVSLDEGAILEEAKENFNKTEASIDSTIAELAGVAKGDKAVLSDDDIEAVLSQVRKTLYLIRLKG